MPRVVGRSVYGNFHMFRSICSVLTPLQLVYTLVQGEASCKCSPLRC